VRPPVELGQRRVAEVMEDSRFEGIQDAFIGRALDGLEDRLDRLAFLRRKALRHQLARSVHRAARIDGVGAIGQPKRVVPAVIAAGFGEKVVSGRRGFVMPDIAAVFEFLEELTLEGGLGSASRYTPASDRQGRLPLYRRARPRSHRIGLALQRRVVVDRRAVGPSQRLSDAPLQLLHHMPGLVREVPLLAGAQMDLRPLRDGMGLQCGRAR
jgi:hypothetical protein